MRANIRKLAERYQKLPVTVKASIWFLFCSFLQKGIAVITTPIFTRLLTSGEYGLYNVFESWRGIIGAFVTLSLAGGMFIQGLVKFERERNVFVSSLQGLGLTLCLVWFGIYLFFKDFWNGLFSLSTVQMTAMFIILWSDLAISFWMSVQRTDCRYHALVRVILLMSILKPILSVCFVRLFADHVTARIMGTVVVDILICPAFFGLQILQGKAFFSKKYWTYALRFTVPLVPHYLSQIVLNNADRIMIRDMVGADKAGIYSLAYSVSLMMTVFNTALLQAIEPWIYKKIKEGRVSELSNVAYPTMLASAGLNLLLILFAPEAVRLFAPAEYLEAIWVIPPVSMSVVFIFSYSFFACFEFYYEKTSFIMVSSLCASASNVLLNRIFIARFGFIAAGYTTLVCYMLYALAHYSFMRKIAREHFPDVEIYNPRVLAGLSVGVLLMGFAALSTYRFPAVRYCACAMALCLIVIKREALMDGIRVLLRMRKAE